jgi:hypothetical protein
MERMESIKAIFFDAGNTLIFPDYRLIQKVLAGHGLRVGADGLFALDCEWRDHYNRRALLGQEAMAVWDTYWPTLLEQIGMSKELQNEVMAELIEQNNAGTFWTSVLEGTPEVLSGLRERGRCLGVISNSEGRLESFLEKVGLRDYQTGERRPSSSGEYVLSVPWSGSAARWAASLGLAGTRCRSVDGAAPQWAGEARKEIERLTRGKAQPFHTSGGTAANTLNTYSGDG